jgi:predicted transcriptional regulator of viral defense system
MVYPMTAQTYQQLIKIIIEQLFTLLINKEIKDFVDVLSEEVKNLAARLGKTGTLDKKVEK